MKSLIKQLLREELDNVPTVRWYPRFKGRIYKDVNLAKQDIIHAVEHDNNQSFAKLFGGTNVEDILKLFTFKSIKNGVIIVTITKIREKRIKPKIEYLTDDELVNDEKYLWSDIRGIEFGRSFSKLTWLNTNDKRIYPHEKLYNENLVKIMDLIYNGTELPPILLDYDFSILDGHHRFEAAKRLGVKKIPVIIYLNPNI